MTPRWTGLVLLAAFVAGAGCQRKTNVQAELSDLAKSFPSVTSTDAAPAEPAVYVHAALEAVRQNDYAGGMVALQAARRMPDMTPQQLKAVQETMQSITSDLVDRAARGDAQAQAALAAIERTRSQ